MAEPLIKANKKGGYFSDAASCRIFMFKAANNKVIKGLSQLKIAKKK